MHTYKIIRAKKLTLAYCNWIESVIKCVHCIGHGCQYFYMIFVHTFFFIGHGSYSFRNELSTFLKCRDFSCFSQSIGAIFNRVCIFWRVWHCFIHYSFFLFFVSSAIHERYFLFFNFFGAVNATRWTQGMRIKIPYNWIKFPKNGKGS